MLRFRFLRHLILWSTFSLATGCFAQDFSDKAPDGSPAVAFDRGCIASTFFKFHYRLPERMTLNDISDLPARNNSTAKAFVLFKASRTAGTDREVVDAGAEDRSAKKDPSANGWVTGLFKWNKIRTDVPSQSEPELLSIGGQQFSRLRFEQKREDGAITYEVAYATGRRGYVIFFIFGSVNRAALESIEKSVESFSIDGPGCSAIH